MAAPLPFGPERPPWWAVVALLSLVNLACAAPYLPEGFQQSKQQSPLDFVSPLKGGMIGPLFRPNDHTSVDLKAVGCYYQFHHYEEGDRIVTNEPCLNCTCHNSMLMCYLKVCPFSKPIGLDCKIEKSPEQCCPVITCPQVPVNLQVMHMTTSTTTVSPAMQMTGIVPYVEHGCTMEGDYYPDGAQMPGNSSKPCELCYCIRNHTACIMQECILKVEGCIPVFQEGICCPVRYKCEGDKPIFPRIGGPEISDSYATVIYQPKETTTASTTPGTTPSTTAGTTPSTTAVPDTTTGEPIAGTTSPTTESQSQTDDPERQLFTGSGARRSKAHEEDGYLLTTTQSSAEVNDTTGLPVTTMIPGSGTAMCVHQNEMYADGASIETDDPCQHCYCMNGDLVCAVHDCKSSLDEAEEGCVPRPPLPGQCCPQGYDCPDQIETSSVLPDGSADATTTIPDAPTDERDPEELEISEPSTAAPTISETDDSHQYGPVSTDDDSVLTRITPQETSQTDPVDEAESPEAEIKFTTDTEISSSTPLPPIDQEEELKDTTAAEESDDTTKSTEELLTIDDTLSTDGPLDASVTSPSPAPSSESEVTDPSASSTVKEAATSSTPLPPTDQEEDFKDTTAVEDSDATTKSPEELLVTDDTLSTAGPLDTEVTSPRITPSSETRETDSLVSSTAKETATPSTPLPPTDQEEEVKYTATEESDDTTKLPEELLVTDETLSTAEPLPAGVTSSSITPSSETGETDSSVSSTVKETAAPSTPLPPTDQEEELKDTTDAEESDKTTKSPEESLATDDTLSTDGSLDAGVTSPSPVPSSESGVTDPSVSSTVEETASTGQPPEYPVTEKDSESSAQPATEIDEETLAEAGSTTSPETEADSFTTEGTIEVSTVSKDPSVSTTSPPSSEKPADASVTETEPSLEPAEEKEPVEEITEISSMPEVTTPGIPGEGDCMMNGVTFADGDIVPTTSACEESCVCRDSVVVCKFKACSPPPPTFLRCTPAEISGECCPRYDCPEPQPDITCEKDGSIYEDGATVPDDNACNECFCTEGKIICAVRECVPPPKGCVATPRQEDSCCPTEYECPSVTPDVGDLVMMTEKPSTDKTHGKTCTENGKVFEDGSIIPPTNACHLTCACKNGDVRCIQKACPPPPPAFLRCVQIEDATSCCPIYECPPPAVDAESGCRFNGVDYSDSEVVPSFNNCEECRCIEGEVVCAEMECVPPGPNCVPIQGGDEMCCPSSYDCSNATEVVMPTSPVFSSVTDDDQFTGSPVPSEISKISPDDSTDSATEKTSTEKTPEKDITLPEDSTASKATTAEPVETTSLSEDSSKPELGPEDTTEAVTAKVPESGVTSPVDVVTSEAAETHTSPGMIDDTRVTPRPSDSDTTAKDTTDIFTAKTSEDETPSPGDPEVEAAMTTPKSIEATTFPDEASEPGVTLGDTTAGVTEKIFEAEVTVAEDSTAPELSESATTPGPVPTTSASLDSSEPEMQADSTAQDDPKLTFGTVTEQSVAIDEGDPKTTPQMLKDQTITEAPFSESTESDVKPDKTEEDLVDASLTTEPDLRISEVTKPEESQDGDTASTVEFESIGSTTKAPVTTISDTKESTTQAYSSEIVTTEASLPSEDDKATELPETDESSTADSVSPEKDVSLESAATTEAPLELEISTEVKYSSPQDETTGEEDAVTDDVTTERTLEPIDDSTSTAASSEPTAVTETTPIREKEPETPGDTVDSDDQTTPSVTTDKITTPKKDSETTATVEPKPEEESTEIPRETDVPVDTVTTSDAVTPASVPADDTTVTALPEGPSDVEVTTGKQEVDTPSTDLATTAKPTQDEIRFTDTVPDIGDSTLYKVPPKETSATDDDSSAFSTTTETISTTKASVISSDAVTGATDDEFEEGVTEGTSGSPDELSTAKTTKAPLDDTSVTSSVETTRTDPSEETELSTSTSVSEDTAEIATKAPSVGYTPEIDSSTSSPASQPEATTIGADQERETTESISKLSTPDLFADTCTVDGTMYFDGEVILSLSFQKCQGKCICNKSVVECSKPACPPPPPQHLNCEAVVKPHQCCPSYTCDDVSPGGDPSLTCEQYGETYQNGQYVPTSFECSDCYCIDSEVICEKIKCQQPIGNCTPLDIPPGKCCPTEYKCTEGDPAREQVTSPASTDDVSLPSTTPSIEEEDQPCVKDGVTYSNGQSVPVSNSCQESCKCTSGSVQCKLQACPPSPPAFLRCVAQEKPDQCCPSYDCPSGIVNATEASSCEKDGLQYQSGELVPSADHCSDCYCIDGAVTCAPLECQAPGPNCIPNAIPEGSCCPTDYDCSDVSPTFDIETDYTPDLTFSSVDETTDGVIPDTATDGDAAVATEGYEIGVTEPSISDTETEVPQQETATILPGSPAVPETEETESESTPLTETTDKPDSLVTDGASEEVISTTPALEEGSCIKDQIVYANGTDIPSSTPCEEMCVCIDGVARCELQACPPAPPAFLRCSPIDQPDQCCPSYDCPEIQPDPTSATNCKVNETEFAEGEYVPSSSYCTDCYCTEGEVVCATIDCEAPGENCLPIEIPEGSCCPTRYSCADPSFTVSTDDYPYSVDSISTRITDDDRIESDVTVPESDTRQTGEDFTTVPSVDDKTSSYDTTSSTVGESPTELPSEADVSSVTTSPVVSTKQPESTSPDEFVPVTTPSRADESETTIGIIDSDTQTYSPTAAPEESETADVTDTTTKSYPDDTVPEVTSVPDTGVSSEAQPEQPTTPSAEKPEEISDATTPSAVESESTTSATGKEETTPLPSDEKDCIVDEITYSDGESVPVSNSCQESCVCVDGTVQCDQRACPPAPPAFFRCTQVETDGCCPSYDCDIPSANATSGGCEYNGTRYNDGQYIPSGTICKDCHCIDSEVVCATIDCPIPGPNCYAIRQSEYGCCPEKYRCDLGESSTEAPATTPAGDAIEMSTRATDYTEDADDVPTTAAPTVGCIKNDKKYKDGEIVESQNKCEDCFCSNGRVLCSALECIPPGENCTAVENSDDGCCPTKYECDDQPTPSLSIPTVPDVEYTDKPLDEVLETRDTIQPTDTTEDDTLPESGSVATAGPKDTDEFTSSTSPIAETAPVTSAPETTVEGEFPTGQPETETKAPSEVTDGQSVPEVEAVTDIPQEGDADVTEAPVQAESTGAPDDTESTGAPEDTASTGAPEDTASTGAPEVAEDTGAPEDTASTGAPEDTASTGAPEDTTGAPEDTTGAPEDTASTGAPEDTASTGAPEDTASTEAPVVPESTEEPDEASTDASILPEVPEASTDTVPGETTDAPEITTSEIDTTGCSVNGIEYQNGDDIPPNECQDRCVCSYGKVSCRKTACPPAPPAFLRCDVENTDGCCPTYQCPNETESTTSGPTCLKEGIEYVDGERVPSGDLCSDCSCIDGRIICATLECEAPGPRCTPVSVPEGICCPEIYDCVEEMDDMAATPAPPQGYETDAAESSTLPPLSSDALSACVVNEIRYEDGEAVAVQNSCQESCSCQGGEVLCILKKCSDKPPSILRCSVVRNSTDECCPSYECPQPAETDQPSCEKDGISYMDGEYVNSTNVCTDCHCIEGDIVCATLECEVPSARCTPMPPSIEECCPSYLCPGETPTETSTESSTTIADTDDSTSLPETATEEAVETESPTETTESPDAESLPESPDAESLPESPDAESITESPDTESLPESPDAESLPEEAPDSATESAAEEATEATTVLDETTPETATLSDSDSVTESTDSAVDSLDESTHPDSETTETSPEAVTSSSIETKPEEPLTETPEVSGTEKPFSTEAPVVGDEVETSDELTLVTTELSISSPVEFSVLDDEDETTEQPTAETPSQPESSPDPSPTDDPEEAGPVVKSTDTTDSTTLSPSEIAQTTLSPVDGVTETSTDPSAETEKQPEIETESSSEAGITSSPSTVSVEAGTETYGDGVTEVVPDQETTEKQPEIVTESSSEAAIPSSPSTVSVEAGTETYGDGVTEAAPDQETTESSPVGETIQEVTDTIESSTLSPSDVSEDGLSTAAPDVDDKELEGMTTIIPDDEALPCQMNETVYSDGDSMPAFSSCQHSCKCSNGTVKCERESCPPTPPQFLRCSPVPNYDEDQCCPTYSCPPSSGTEGAGEASCMKDDNEFLHGESVPSPTICTDCHCIDGVIVCAEIDCGVPGPNCSPVYQAEAACCPSTYECQETTPSYTTFPTSEDPDQETPIYTPPELEAVVVEEDKTTPPLPADTSDGLATTFAPELVTDKDDETSTTKTSIKPATDSLTTFSPEKTEVEDEEKSVTEPSTPADIDDLATRITVDQETDDELTTVKPETSATKKPDAFEKEPVTPVSDVISEETFATGTEKDTDHEDRTTPLPSISSTPLPSASSTPSSDEEKVTDTDEIATRITAPEVDEGEEIISTTEADESDIPGPSFATIDTDDESTVVPSVTESAYSDAPGDVTDAITVPVEEESDGTTKKPVPGDLTAETDEDSIEPKRTEEPMIHVTEESIDRSTPSSVTKFEESSETSTEGIKSTSHKPDDVTEDGEIVSTRITDPEVEPELITSSPVTEPTRDVDSDSLVSSTSAPKTTVSAVDESTSEDASTTIPDSSTDKPEVTDVSEKIPDAISDDNATYSTDISDATLFTVSSSEEPSELETEYTKAPELDKSSRLPESSTIKSTDLTTDESITESIDLTESSTPIPSAPEDISESKITTTDIETSTESIISGQEDSTQVPSDVETLSTRDEEEMIQTDQPSTESQLAVETTTEKRSTLPEIPVTSSPKVGVTDGTPAVEVTETSVDGITSDAKFDQTEKMPAVGDLSFSTDETPTFAVVDEEETPVTSSPSSAPTDDSSVPDKTNDTTVAPTTHTERPDTTKVPEISPTESTAEKLTTTSIVEEDKPETSSITPEPAVKVTPSETDGETQTSPVDADKLTTRSPFTSTTESVDDAKVTDDIVSTRITSSDATDEETPSDDSTVLPTDDFASKTTTVKAVSEEESSSPDASITTPVPHIDSSITELPDDAEAPSVASESTEGPIASSTVESSPTTAPTDKITDSPSLPSEKPDESTISESPSKTAPTRTTATSEISSPSTPASTTLEVKETTAVTSPPPLYQTPRPGTTVTGYTSAFPPFPGGLFPSSSTTWKPNTTPDFVLGPGACMFDGKVYVSAQQILRDDPCDFCFCFRGDIICLQQSCPPPVPGCFEEPIPGFCCPRYECPLTKAIVNITTTTTPLPTYPPLQRAEEIVMCEIGDRFYHTGEIVEEASGPCLECRCGDDGMMECDPKDCPASPMLGKIFTKGRSVKNES